ncbi:hypothetical protein GCM10023192_34570 [Amycolatopsis samaneae]
MSKALEADLDQDMQSKLALGYELALGQAFLIDDLNDGQTSTADVKLISALKEIEVASVVDAIGWPRGRVAFSWSGTQAAALCAEEESYLQKRRPLPSGNILGRSAPVLSYYQAIAYGSSQERVQTLKKLITQYLLVAQWCDDLYDWEDDLLAGRFTPVVHEFVTSAGFESCVDYEESHYPSLLRAVYLGGLLLRELRRCHARLSDVVAGLCDIGSAAEDLVVIVLNLKSIVESNIAKLGSMI